MSSAENMYRFTFIFIVTTLIVVYGSLFSTLISSPGTSDVPERCSSGCPMRRKDDLFIKNVVECLYTNGELSESRVYLGDVIKICEIESDHGSYKLHTQQTIMY